MLFIRDKHTFKTRWYGEPSSWSNLPLGSDENSSGTIVVRDDKISLDRQGDIACMDGRVWVIDKITHDPDSGTSSISVKDIINLFYYIYPAGYKSRPSSEDYWKAIIEYHYVGNADSFYKRPYLVPSIDSSGGKTNPIEPEYTEGTYFKEDEYLRKCCTETNGMRVGTKYDKDTLHVVFWHRNNTPHKLIFGDGHHYLKSQDFSKDIVSKVTVTVKATMGAGSSQTTFTEQDIPYYLQSDGSVKRDTVPVPRIEGKWINRYVECNVNNMDFSKKYNAGTLVKYNGDHVYRCNHDTTGITLSASNFYTYFTRYAETIAEQEILNNVDTYKIEFYSDMYYPWQDRLTMKFEDGKVFTGVITEVSISSDDDRYYYKVGSLPNTVTEKLKKKYKSK